MAHEHSLELAWIWGMGCGYLNDGAEFEVQDLSKGISSCFPGVFIWTLSVSSVLLKIPCGTCSFLNFSKMKCDLIFNTLLLPMKVEWDTCLLPVRIVNLSWELPLTEHCFCFCLEAQLKGFL